MNKVILAPAGGKKTQTIIDMCCEDGTPKEILILTYTTTGQKVIQDRLWKSKSVNNHIEVMGWFSFLLNHIVKPYINNLFPNQEVNGLHFVEGSDPVRFQTGSKRYFDTAGKVYSHNIGKLSLDILYASEDECIERLQGIYDEIFIDEVQDLAGNDLDIIELLFKSKIKVVAVGDVRQSIYSTSKADRKNKKYKGLNKILWFRDMESKNLCEIEERTSTWRCNQEIVNFADSVLPKDLEFPTTESLQDLETEHDGVFVVSWENLQGYMNVYHPKCYRYRIDSKILEGSEAINFGLCKGETVLRALIYPTEPMKKFLKNPMLNLADTSAAQFYVAVTRAVHSVAIVVEKPGEYTIKEWTPD